MIGSAEAAELLDIDRSTLTRWANAKQIAVAHRGTGTTGELFFYRADVLARIPHSSPAAKISAIPSCLPPQGDTF